MAGDPVGDAERFADDDIRSILGLERVDDDTFRGLSPNRQRARVFGGQVIGQALVAGAGTVDAPHVVNSLHAYFLRAGDYRTPITYGVERLRSGRSFSARRGTARQRGETLLVMSASFHGPETGGYYQATVPVHRGDPQQLPPTGFSSSVIETRDASYDQPQGPTRSLWFRAPVDLGDDDHLHAGAMAYATDHGPFGAARRVTGGRETFDAMYRASLDHAIWFHRVVRADEWLHYEITVVAHRGARILTQGVVSDQAGLRVATISQEILARPPT